MFRNITFKDIVAAYGDDVLSGRGVERYMGRSAKKPSLRVFLRAIGRACGRPCGAAEARRWGWDEFRDGTRLDARPAVDMFRHGLSIGQAVAVYRKALEEGLWERGYGSPYSPTALVVWTGLRRRWSTAEIMAVNQAYGGGRLPKDALHRARLILALRKGFRRVSQGERLDLVQERLAIRALSRMKPGRRSYCAVLGALVTSTREGGAAPDQFWAHLRAQLARKTSALMEEWGSPKMQWGVLGVKADPGARICPPHGCSGRAAKELAALVPPSSRRGGLHDDVLQPMRNLLAAFGKKAAEMVPLLGGTVHDAGQFVPSKDPAIAKAAGDFVLGHRKALKDRLLQDLEKALEEAKLLLSNFAPEMAKLGWREAVEACRANQYGPDVPPNVAAVAAELALSKERAVDFVEWLKKHPAKSKSNLPSVRVTATEVGLEGDWEFTKLPDDDVRGPLLGLYTDCCQHPKGAGAACAAHGWESPDGGFYVVRYRGRIVAQSWAWRSGSVVVMDNIEALSVAYKEGVLALYRAAAERMLAADPTLTAIHVGEGYDDAGVDGLPVVDPVYPVDYTGYRDSNWQRLLARRFESPIPLEELLSIERAAYPDHMREMQDCVSWQDVAEYACPDGEELVVLGKPGRWYAILAVRGDEAEAVDIAKVPGTATVPWRTLAAEIRRRGIRRIALDARKATSYTVLKGLAPKFGGRVEEESPWSWEGEAMVHMIIAF